MEEQDNKKSSENRNKDWWRESLLIFARFSAWVIGPVIVGAVLGKWLEAKYNGGQLIFLGTIGIAFIISIAGLIIEAGKEFGKIEKSDKDKDKESDKINH